MSHFFDLIFSFPVVMFSFLLCVAVFYWILACFGLVDVEALTAEIYATSIPDGAQFDGVAGLLCKVGLAGVPISIVFTLLAMFGWFFSYFIQLLVLSPLSPGFFYYAAGGLSAVGIFIAAVSLTSLILRPLRAFLRRLEGAAGQPMLGRVAVVRSAMVTGMRGEVMLEDGGAGLILQVRTDDTMGFKRGDRVVLLQYLAEEHVYQVISESQFKG